MKKSRRKFIKNSSILSLGGILGAGLPLEAIAKMRKSVSANEKINFAVIGCKGQGWSNMRSILKNSEANCIGLCDVDKDVLDTRSNDVEKITGKKPKLYGDYRKMLENKDIDAVVIGTPDHWHCLNLVDSLEAGKHAYCEKPISNSITEANIMLESSKYHGKCVQVGQWQRSGGQYQEAIDYLWTGKLGKIRLVKAWAYQGWYGWVDEKPNKDWLKRNLGEDDWNTLNSLRQGNLSSTRGNSIYYHGAPFKEGKQPQGYKKKTQRESRILPGSQDLNIDKSFKKSGEVVWSDENLFGDGFYVSDDISISFGTIVVAITEPIS